MILIPVTEIIDELTEWAIKFIKIRSVVDTSISKKIMSILVLIFDQTFEFMYVVTILNACGQVLPEIDAEGEDDHDQQVESFEMVNEHTAEGIILVWMVPFMKLLDDIDWVLAQLKKMRSKGHERCQDIEDNVCEKLVPLLGILSRLEKMDLNDVASEQRMKILAKVFKVLGALVRQASPRFNPRNFCSQRKLESRLKKLFLHAWISLKICT